jgi:hypothetical protein
MSNSIILRGLNQKKKGRKRRAEREAEERCQATMERYGTRTKGRVPRDGAKKGSGERVEKKEQKCEMLQMLLASACQSQR